MYKNTCLGGGFKHVLFSSLFGEDSLFDSYFSDGLKPPTSCTWWDMRINLSRWQLDLFFSIKNYHSQLVIPWPLQFVFVLQPRKLTAGTPKNGGGWFRWFSFSFRGDFQVPTVRFGGVLVITSPRRWPCDVLGVATSATWRVDTWAVLLIILSDKRGRKRGRQTTQFYGEYSTPKFNVWWDVPLNPYIYIFAWHCRLGPCPCPATPRNEWNLLVY